MNFGLGPFGVQLPEGDPISRSELYEQSLLLAERAETVGFDSAWVSEHHFTSDGYLPSPMTLAAGIGARTTDLEVGTALALAPMYEPVRLAEDAAVVDNISRGSGADGRFTLGIGLGYRDIEYEGLRVEKSRRVGRLLDVVETCRAAWQGAPIGEGRVVNYPNVTVSPTPASDIDIVIGAMSPAALRRAARVGDGYLVPPSVSLEELADKLDIIADELAEHNREPADFPVYVLRYGFLHSDGERAAWEAICDEYLYLRRKYLKWFNESDDSDTEYSAEELDEAAEEAVDEWRSWTICGDENDWIDTLAPYEDCWEGTVTSIVQLRYPGMKYDDVEQAVGRFGSEVIPHLRKE